MQLGAVGRAADIARSGERRQVSGARSLDGSALARRPRIWSDARSSATSAALRSSELELTIPRPCDQCVQAGEPDGEFFKNSERRCLRRPRGRGAVLGAAIERLGRMEVLLRKTIDTVASGPVHAVDTHREFLSERWCCTGR